MADYSIDTTINGGTPLHSDVTAGVTSTLTGLDRSYISGIERGERNPSLTNVFKIAHALSVTASEIHVRAEARGA